MKTPQSEADLADIIKGANAPFALRGGGTRGIPAHGTPLHLGSLTGVTLYEPGALTLVARTGTAMAEIERVLAAENQRLAFEPMDHRGLLGTDGEPTIGGVVAGNVSGPRRIQAGACRDFLLGVRFVDGSGTVIKNGGRVMKNVTGYDLVKLMAGSWGTLGVLTEVSLKVLPTAETEATLSVQVPSATDAVRVMSSALGSPFDVTGAAYRPDQGDAVIRIEGFNDSVRYRTGKLKDLLGGFGRVDANGDPEASAQIWCDIRDVAAFHDAPGDVWRVSVKPTDGPDVMSRADGEGALMDWGGGLVWLRLPPGTDLRARLGAFDGHATLVRANADTHARLGTFQPEPAALRSLSRGLRERFDPRGLFNPGLMETAVEA